MMTKVKLTLEIEHDPGKSDLEKIADVLNHYLDMANDGSYFFKHPDIALGQLEVVEKEPY